MKDDNKKILFSLIPLNEAAARKEWFTDDTDDEIERIVQKSISREDNYDRYGVLVNECQEFLNERVKGVKLKVTVKPDANPNAGKVSGDDLDVEVVNIAENINDVEYIIRSEKEIGPDNTVLVPPFCPQGMYIFDKIFEAMPGEDDEKYLKIVLTQD